MAGVKGRSGGARKGAGRKPKLRAPSPEGDPRAYLLEVMKDETVSATIRNDAAKALLPYFYKKKGQGKDEKEEGSGSPGRFGAIAPPKLVVNRG